MTPSPDLTPSPRSPSMLSSGIGSGYDTFTPLPSEASTSLDLSFDSSVLEQTSNEFSKDTSEKETGDHSDTYQQDEKSEEGMKTKEMIYEILWKRNLL